MKYRAEIDGLRALAVIPVILFHAGIEIFRGGFIGVDIFFVISGYLITTILINDIEQKRFSLVHFYERRARRILPALILVMLASTIAAYTILFPSDLEEYSQSLLWALGFASNIFFWRNSDYFATEAELLPMLHTWSLAVEEQYYLFFPLLLLFTWRCGKTRVFFLIATIAVLSLTLSEWGWRYKEVANFYLAPTRAWELLAGSMAAFALQYQGAKNNNLLALVGLLAIVSTMFLYSDKTPFPSLYAAVPVAGVVLLILYAHKDTWVARLLSTKILVGIGLISYSAYLWHQPLFAFYRRLYGIELSLLAALSLVSVTIILSVLSWRFVEQPFRNQAIFNRKQIFTLSIGGSGVVVLFAVFLIATNGADYRFGAIEKAKEWETIECHGKDLENDINHIITCLGDGSSKTSGNIYLIGDSHAAQLTFALKKVAELRGVEFYFINSEDDLDYPYSFWSGPVTEDRLLDHVLNVANRGDYFVTTFHRGRFNKDRDRHLDMTEKVMPNEKVMLYADNIEKYLNEFQEKGMSVYFVKDGPLLPDSETSLESCMYKYKTFGEPPCIITIDQDEHTRTQQSKAFEGLAEKYQNAAALDYLPVLYNYKEQFSPISPEGTYLMFDRHHLTKEASLLLVDFFDTNIIDISQAQ